MCVPVRLDQRNEMEFYRPLAQENFPFLTITVRSSLPPARAWYSRRCDLPLKEN